ncbi:MAG: hypothetical protein CMC70_07925 [Flavobacteriaceae bacterium]|nr:hypothetical protein [Flavobacteriaceae bacterium]
MKTATKLPLILFFGLLFFSLVPTTYAQPYTINSEFSNTTEYDYVTEGIYIVWWDNEWDYEADALELLTYMQPYRDYCLDILDMQDPPNPTDGFFYNVYLHHGEDDFPSWWGNGQGTDSNGYPYLTLPIGAHNDWVNVAHETFHVFQYSATSQGFAYSGDSQWYIEASANWFAAIQNEGVAGAFLEAESLVRLPHVALWLSYDNFPNNYPENWQRYVHQYALALFLYYMSEHTDVPDELITNGMYAGTNDLPQEYFFNQLGAEVFRNHFLDWAARMTNHFDFLPTNQIERFELEWNDYADPEDDNEFIATYANEGTNGWVRPADENITTGWSYNTYKINVTEADNYLFEIKGDEEGSAGSDSFFQGKVLVQDVDGNAQFYDVPMLNEQEGSFFLEVSENDTAIYLIVASVPETFTDVEQTYGYEVNITKGAVLGVPENDMRTTPPKVIARYDLLGRKVLENYVGIQIVKFDDGSVKKIYNPR